MDKTVNASKIDKGAKLGDTSDFALAPLTNNEILQGLPTASIAFFTGNEGLARARGPRTGTLSGTTLA
jgi:hypothetical protein